MSDVNLIREFPILPVPRRRAYTFLSDPKENSYKNETHRIHSETIFSKKPGTFGTAETTTRDQAPAVRRPPSRSKRSGRRQRRPCCGFLRNPFLRCPRGLEAKKVVQLAGVFKGAASHPGRFASTSLALGISF